MFDEIIIIDTGSADNTLSKILNLNHQKVTIYNYKWKNDFSKARNFGINKANSKWVAFIDADEEMGNEYKENFRQLISFLDCSNNKKNIVLTFTIKEKEKGNIFNDIPRIIYREGNCRYFGMVHEEIRCNQGNLILIMLNTIIYHDGYNEVVLNHKKKILRNLYLLKQMMNEEKENSRWVYFYCRSF